MDKNLDYHCDDCQATFKIRAFIARNADKMKRPIACPHCNHTNTGRVGCTVRRRPQDTPMDASPTEAQLKYIIALKGNTRGIKTKKDAGEYITRLKKLKGSSA